MCLSRNCLHTSEVHRAARCGHACIYSRAVQLHEGITHATASMNTTSPISQSGNPTADQYRSIWRGYSFANGSLETGCIIPAYYNTSSTCSTAGGTPQLNISVADVVPYSVYFCQLSTGDLIANVSSAYHNAYGMILVACQGVASATPPKGSGAPMEARVPKLLAWSCLISGLVWLASISI